MKRRTLGLFSPRSSGIPGWLILAGLVALAIWLIPKLKVASYNAERVELERDERGRIKALTVHRSTHD